MVLFHLVWVEDTERSDDISVSSTILSTNTKWKRTSCINSIDWRSQTANEALPEFKQFYLGPSSGSLGKNQES